MIEIYQKRATMVRQRRTEKTYKHLAAKKQQKHLWTWTNVCECEDCDCDPCECEED